MADEVRKNANFALVVVCAPPIRSQSICSHYSSSPSLFCNPPFGFSSAQAAHLLCIYTQKSDMNEEMQAECTESAVTCIEKHSDNNEVGLSPIALLPHHSRHHRGRRATVNPPLLPLR